MCRGDKKYARILLEDMDTVLYVFFHKIYFLICGMGE